MDNGSNGPLDTLGRPWQAVPMPTYVQASPDWCTGTISGAGIDGYRVNTFRPSTHPQAFAKGPLDGEHFPTREAATEAMCKAGLLRLWLGLHPTERLGSSRYRRK